MESKSRGFWDNLPRPFFALAPMADVTDAAFRAIVAKYGKPDVMFTEFVSADGLAHPDAVERLKLDLKHTESERPIVAQIFGSKPENIKSAAALCQELGFDGVDINMGCPVKTINKQHAGAELIRNPGLAKEVILAAMEGAPDLPVSVKSRIGYSNTLELESWMNTLLETSPATITMHLRTKKEMSKVPAHWELAGELARLRDTAFSRRSAPPPLASGSLTRARESNISHPRVIANGDVVDLRDAREKAEANDLDGVMLGRAIYGNPWLFAGKDKEEIPWSERLGVMLEHTKLFEEMYKGKKNFNLMKKFYGAYISGHHEAKRFKEALMACGNYMEVEEVVGKFSL